MNDFLDKIVVYLIIAFFAGIPLMFVFRVSYKYFIGMFQRKKKLQYAKDSGNVVEAYCVKRTEPTGIPESTDKYYATYSFESDLANTFPIGVSSLSTIVSFLVSFIVNMLEYLHRIGIFYEFN